MNDKPVVDRLQDLDELTLRLSQLKEKTRIAIGNNEIEIKELESLVRRQGNFISSLKKTRTKPFFSTRKSWDSSESARSTGYSRSTGDSVSLASSYSSRTSYSSDSHTTRPTITKQDQSPESPRCPNNKSPVNDLQAGATLSSSSNDSSSSSSISSREKTRQKEARMRGLLARFQDRLKKEEEEGALQQEPCDVVSMGGG